MKKIILSASLVFLSIAGYSQVIISQLPINPARMSLEDLWGMTIINSEADFKGYFIMTVSEDNGFLVELVSEPVDIKNGANHFNGSSVRYSIHSVNTRNPEAQALSQSKFFSFGQYRVCVRLIKQNMGDEYESCLDHEFLPLTPPMLVSPDYCSELATTTPIFVWLPPTPLIPGMEIYYDLKIAEVYEGQSHQDAIDNNNPHFTASELTINSLNYPLGAAPFDTSKLYVWQVSARIKKYNGGENMEITDRYKGIGVSEVWCFHWKKKEIPPPILTTYVYPKTELDGGVLTIGNIFYLAHREKSGKTSIRVSFYNENGEKLNSVYDLDSKRGDNRYELNLRSTGEFRHKTHYTLELLDSKGKVYRVKFLYWEE